MTKFEKAMALLLRHEGNYSDLPGDGATRYGINKKYWNGEKSFYSLTLDDAIKFYQDHYWYPLCLDKITSDELTAVIFDMAVNQGPNTVFLRLSHILGIPFKEIFTSEALAELNSEDPKELGLKLLSSCAQRYCEIVRANPDKEQFLMGWINRVMSNVRYLVVGLS
jgi:lysozyme family protein